MNLIDFIKYLKSDELMRSFINEHYPDMDYYDVEVYLKKSLTVESELVFFEEEKTDGMIKIELNGERYYSLFPLDLLIEVFEDYSKLLESDDEIARQIISYRIDDA